MNNEITILCNSPQCLAEISTGGFGDLSEQNIFTCNMAYTFFRTNKRHLNIFSDSPLIESFFNTNDWYNNFGVLNYDLEFIFHLFHCKGITIPKTHEHLKIKTSPDLSNNSSAINALIYLNECENFDTINLVGYTLNEWEGIKGVNGLELKNEALDKVKENYYIHKHPQREFIWIYKRK